MELKRNGKLSLSDFQGSVDTRHQKAAQDFVLLWGEMASSWGINRTMAQIHALLYISDEPLDTDEIMARLAISRGNANMNLRTLMNWDLIRKVHQMGSRKDFYTSEKDVWKMAALIIQERMKREIRPVRVSLERSLQGLVGHRMIDQQPNPTMLPPVKEGLEAKDQVLAERLYNFIVLLQLFERFTDAVLPVIQTQQVEQIKQLSELAERLHAS